jgi:porin
VGVLGLALASGHALAQTTSMPPSNPSVVAQASVPGASPQNINPELAIGVPNPFLPGTPSVRSGPLAPLANRLADYGLNFHALYLGAMEYNPSTGERTGQSAFASEIRPGVDIDLDKIFSIPGAQIHIDESIFFLTDNVGHGPSFATQASGYFSANPIMQPKRDNYLTLLTYEQKLLHDRIDIEVGRMNANHYFDLPNCTTGLTCGDPIEMLSGGGAPPAYAFWGGRASYQLTPTYYIQVGAFENDPTDTDTHGFRWTTSSAAGAKYDAELGYKSSFAQVAYPGNYELIGVYNTDHFKLPDGTATRQGTFSILTRLQQTIWRADHGATAKLDPANIAAFGSISADPDKFQPYNYFVQAGLTYTGFLPSRPLDRIGIMGSWVSVAKHELNFQREARVAAGGPNVMTPSNSFSFEVDASIFLAADAALQPFIEYNINNDTFYNVNSPTVPKDGVVVGATLIVYLGRFLGLAAPPSP